VKSSQKSSPRARRIVFASATAVAALALLPLASAGASTDTNTKASEEASEEARQSMGVDVRYPEEVNCLFVDTPQGSQKVGVEPAQGITSVSVQVRPGDKVVIEGAQDTPCDGAPYTPTGYFAELEVGDPVPAGTTMVLRKG
jgi:hypothetical protein